MGVLFEGGTGQLGAQVRAANAYINNISNCLAGAAQPFPCANFIACGFNRLQLLFYQRYALSGLAAVGVFWLGTQSGMQHGAVFCAVNGFTSKHGCTVAEQWKLLG